MKLRKNENNWMDCFWRNLKETKKNWGDFEVNSDKLD